MGGLELLYGSIDTTQDFFKLTLFPEYFSSNSIKVEGAKKISSDSEMSAILEKTLGSKPTLSLIELTCKNLLSGSKTFSKSLGANTGLKKFG